VCAGMDSPVHRLQVIFNSNCGVVHFCAPYLEKEVGCTEMHNTTISVENDLEWVYHRPYMVCTCACTFVVVWVWVGVGVCGCVCMGVCGCGKGGVRGGWRGYLKHELNYSVGSTLHTQSHRRTHTYARIRSPIHLTEGRGQKTGNIQLGSCYTSP